MATINFEPETSAPAATIDFQPEAAPAASSIDFQPEAAGPDLSKIQSTPVNQPAAAAALPGMVLTDPSNLMSKDAGSGIPTTGNVWQDLQNTRGAKPSDALLAKDARLAQTPQQSAQLAKAVSDINTPALPVSGLAGQVTSAVMAPPKTFTDIVEVGRGIQENNRDTTIAMRAMAQKHGLDPDKVAPLPGMVESWLRGGGNAIVDTALSLTAPGMLATGGLAKLPTAVQRAASLGFAAQMVTGFPEQAQQFQAEMAKPADQRDNQKIAQMFVGMLGTEAFTGMAAAHGLAPGKTATPAAFQPKPNFQGPLATGAVLPQPEGVSPEALAGLQTAMRQRQGEALKPNQPLGEGFQTPAGKPVAAPEPPAATLTPPPVKTPPIEATDAGKAIQTPSLPPMQTGEKMVTVQRADGTTYPAAVSGNTLDHPTRGEVPWVARLNQSGDAWSLGLLGADETILPQETAAPPSQKGGTPSEVSGVQAPALQTSPTSEVTVKGAAKPQIVKPEGKPSGFNPPPMPERFDSLQDVIAYRNKYRASELAFYKSLGLDDKDAMRMMRSADSRSNLDTSSIEAKLTPENQQRLDDFSTGEGSEMYQWDRQYDPEELTHETDKSELARHVVQNLSRESAPTDFGDKLLHAVVSLRQLKENGGTWSDVARELDKHTTRNSSSQGDKAEIFKMYGEKIKQFAAQQGIDLPQGEFGSKLSPPVSRAIPPASPATAPPEPVSPSIPAKETGKSDVVKRVAETMSQDLQSRMKGERLFLNADTARQNAMLAEHSAERKLPEAEKFAAALESKDPAYFIERNNGMWQSVWKAFEAETGIKPGKTQKAIAETVRKFVGPENYDRVLADRNKVRADKLSADEAASKQRQRDYELKKAYRYAMGGAGEVKPVTAKVMIEDLIARGYTRAESAKRGVVNVLRLWKGDTQYMELRPKAEQEYARELIAKREQPTPPAPAEKPGYTITDVTPKGYGVEEPSAGSVESNPATHLTTEQQGYLRTINEGKTILKGKLSLARKSSIQRAVDTAQSKLDATGYKAPRDIDQPYAPAEKPAAVQKVASPMRSAAKEFHDLAMSLAPEKKWVSEKTLDAAMSADAGKNNLGTMGIKGNIERGKAIKKVWEAAAKELGLDPAQIGSEAYRAKHIEKIRTMAKQAGKFDEAVQYDQGKETVEAGDLKVGDSLNVAGEDVKVVAVRADHVELEDGRKFGKQTVPNGKTLYVEGYEPKEEAKPALSLEMEGDAQRAARESQEAASAKTKADKERLAKLAAKPLIGSSGDIGQGTLTGEGDMFSGDLSSGKLGKVGMGGAKLGEVEPSPKTPTGIKNATVDEERAKRGLPPAMEPARRSFGKVWDEAMSKVDKDPQAQQDLINELRDKPRAVTDTEDAMLLQRQIALQNDYGEATRDLAQAHDDATNAPNEEAAASRAADAVELKLRVARLSDELLDIYNINKRVGTETGRGLNARKMMAYEDYSLAAMETKLRAAKGGASLTPEESARIQSLSETVDRLQKQIDDYEKRATEEKPRYSQVVIKIAERVVSTLDTRAEAARARIRERASRLNAGIDPTMLADYAEIGASHLAHIGLDFAKWSDAMIAEFGDKIKPSLKHIFDASQRKADSLADEMAPQNSEVKRAVKKQASGNPALKALKTRYANRAEELKARMAGNDFTPKGRTPLQLDAEAQKLKAAYENSKLAFDRMVMAERLKNRTMLQKTQDTFSKWRRAFLLSSPVTLAKLTSAAVERLAFTPIEEGVGAVFSRVPGLRGVAERAPREGGMSVKAEAKALTDGFTKGMKDAYTTLMTGHSDMDSLFGRRDVMPRSMIDFVGSIHGMLKAPVKRAEFARSFQKRVEFAIRQGQDVSDPLVQTRIALDAYKDANRSIFMQDNKVSSAWNAGLHILESPDKATGKVPAGRKTLATIGRTLLPIVKVPTNIVAETLQTAFGSVTGSARLAHALYKGVETLKPDEADLIMRELKKGSLGAALLTLGFLNPSVIGGYYQMNDKKQVGHPKFGSITIGGVNVPTFLIHNPLLETLQIGATIRHVADSKLRKHDNETQGVPAGTMAALLGLVEEVPFAKEPMELTKMFNPYERAKFENQFAKDLIVPLGVSWVAKHFDKDASGKYVARDQGTFANTIKAAIPLLRQTVPVDPTATAKLNQ